MPCMDPAKSNYVELEKIRYDLKKSIRESLGHEGLVALQVVNDSDPGVFLERFFLEVTARVEITGINLHEVMPAREILRQIGWSQKDLEELTDEECEAEVTEIWSAK